MSTVGPVSKADCDWCGGRFRPNVPMADARLCEEHSFERGIYKINDSRILQKLSGRLKNLQGMLPSSDRDALIERARSEIRAVEAALAAPVAPKTDTEAKSGSEA